MSRVNLRNISVAIAALAIAAAMTTTPATAQTPETTPRPREISGVYQSVDNSGSKIADLPAGNMNTFVVYDTVKRQATLYALQADTEIIRVALSRDGSRAAALIITGQPRFPQRQIILIDMGAGTYRPINSNAIYYNPELAFDSTGAYLFYGRSPEDIHRHEATGPITQYTHQFYCCSQGSYVARYTLDTQTEEIVGPFLAPQGRMLSGFQTTAAHIYFYAFGLTRAIEFNYDPAAPREVQDERRKAASDTDTALFLTPHPSDIETYTEKDHGFLERMLFRMPTRDLVMKDHVPLSKPADWGIGANDQTGDDVKMETLQPEFSDDEKTIFFYANGHRCWGDVAEGKLIACKDPGDGGLLSHDGKRMVFLTQGQRPLGNHGRTVTPRLCTIERHQTVKDCKWLKVDSLTQATITLTRAD